MLCVNQLGCLLQQALVPFIVNVIIAVSSKYNRHIQNIGWQGNACIPFYA